MSYGRITLVWLRGTEGKNVIGILWGKIGLIGLDDVRGPKDHREARSQDF